MQEEHLAPLERRNEKDAGRMSDIRSLAGGASGRELERSNGLAYAALAEDGRISRSEAKTLLSHLGNAHGVCLVGGQSVGLWAHVLDPEGVHLSRYMPYATSDIDYFGDLSAARMFANRAATCSGRART